MNHPRKNSCNKNGFLRRLGTLVLVLFSLSLLLSACVENGEELESRPAAYGDEGARFARELARRFPDRSPGSASERAAGDFIRAALTDMGYEPEVMSFNFADEDDTIGQSRNIWISIPGTAVIDPEWPDWQERRRVIVGAHYDTAIGADIIRPEEDEPDDEQEPEETTESLPDPDGDEMTDPVTVTDPFSVIYEPDWRDYDGIHDNASGVAVLMTLAREIRSYTLTHDVVLVFFGAGEADQSGAHTFVNRMTQEDRELTDVVYILDGIYAGDKVYAHSGWNSLRTGNQKDYEMRRRLYELTDVFYTNELFTRNGFMLYTNQASIYIELPQDPVPEPEPDENDQPEEPAVPDDDLDENGEITPIPTPTFLYREWTVHVSDYRPFDEKGIPIVFFDSGDYDLSDPDDFTETNNPAFSATDGMIRHTGFDSAELLAEIFTVARSAVQRGDRQPQAERLEMRVNNLAFLILEAIGKVAPDIEE